MNWNDWWFLASVLLGYGLVGAVILWKRHRGEPW
jgi:hypothetical protein